MNIEDGTLSEMIVEALSDAIDKYNKKTKDIHDRVSQVRLSIELGEEASPQYKLVGELHPELFSSEGGCFYKLYRYNETGDEPDAVEIFLT